jgi:heme/copper-type cytochrome/quinol oxidase subunit 3
MTPEYVPLTWLSPQLAPVLLGLILIAGAGTGLLFLAAVVAYRRRGTRRYLLITGALGALFVRSIVGTATVFGVIPMVVHHLASHGLDLLVAATLLFVIAREG